MNHRNSNSVTIESTESVELQMSGTDLQSESQPPHFMILLSFSILTLLMSIVEMGGMQHMTIEL
jgi:hypothetical protein